MIGSQGTQAKANDNTNDPAKWQSYYLPRTGQAKLARNSYVKIESHLKLNSVPSYDNPTADGVMQGWFNGQLAVDRQGFAWRRDASQKMNYAWIFFWTGGGATDPTWFQPQDQKMYMRSLVISTKPITH